MSDVDQLLDSLVADVRSHTRAPGAPAAIKQARRRRTTVSVATAVATVAVLAAGSALAGTTLGGGSEGISSLAGPVTPTTGPPDSPQDAASDLGFVTEVGKTLTSVPSWSATDGDPTALHPCGGDWSTESGGTSGGTFGLTPSGEGPLVWSDILGFPSAAQASAAVDRLRRNLSSCSTVWQIQPLAQTGAFLASSDAAVIWIHQRAASVSTLQVPTTNGPPPLPVQARISDLIYSWMA